MHRYQTHVVPTCQGGVKDYVKALEAYGMQLRTVPLDEPNQSKYAFSGDVVLHYVGYGYAKRGAPLWLLRKLRSERKGIARLTVWFHELYATGYPWRSAFWLSLSQRQIASELFRISDRAITSGDIYKAWLSKRSTKTPCHVLAVPSNVGESKVAAAKREPNAIIFGGPALRTRTYQSALPVLRRLKGDGYRLHDIGPRMSSNVTDRHLESLDTVVHGQLSPSEISSILSTASLGIITYPESHLTKSGVFAAYASHGVCPIVNSVKNQSNNSGPRRDVEYLTSDMIHLSTPNKFSQIGEAAWDWYQGHDLSKHAMLLAAP